MTGVQTCALPILTKDRFNNFDLVIFDEASQIKPEDAICSILRADQIVVVGDNRQLPPTTFFETEMSDSALNSDDESIGDFESILDKCSTFLRPSIDEDLCLKWHYRSKKEDLIAFSNNKFYNNNLITFPNSNSEPGIEFHYVKEIGRASCRERV